VSFAEVIMGAASLAVGALLGFHGYGWARKARCRTDGGSGHV
jgi:uncharacterized membrane protein